MPHPDVVCIYNPTSGGGKTRKHVPAVRASLEAAFDSLEIRATEGPGHATVLSRAALESGASLVIALGGDGTTNEVLAGFVDSEGNNRFPGAELGILATGTGSDFVRHLGPAPLEEQLRAVTAGDAYSVDYGVAQMVSSDGQPLLRPFLNEASVGVSGLVSKYVQRAPRLFGSAASYVWSSLRSLSEHRDKAVTLILDDDVPVRLPLTLAVFANGQYFGGGMWIAPEARCDDGLFDVLYTGGNGKAYFLSLLARVFAGKHVGARGVSAARSRTVRMVPEDERDVVLIALDGEQPGRLPASFHIVHHGIRVRALGLPAAAAASSGAFEPVGEPAREGHLVH
jgi:YegS/Rv2252/BmrU family lipid kinase